MYLWLLLWVPLTGVCLHSLRLLRDTWQLGRPQCVLPASAEHWKRDMAAHTQVLKTSFRVSQIMFISLAKASLVTTLSLKRAGNFAWKKEELETLGEQHQLRSQASVTGQALC